MTIQAILEGVLAREGWPHVVDLKDGHGLSKGGISIQTLSRFRGHRVTQQDLIDLTEHEAIKLYEVLYVRNPGFITVQDEALQAQLVDDGVLSGPMTAIQALQRRIGVSADGILGMRTLAAIPVDPAALVKLRVGLAIDRTLRLGILARTSADAQRQAALSSLTALLGNLSRLAVYKDSLTDLQAIIAALSAESKLEFLIGWQTRSLSFLE